MNLGAIATAVGQRLGVDTSQGSTRDGAAVRSSLSLRHDQLYRAFLWKDAIIEWVLPVNQTYTPTSNYMPTKGRVICPSIFQLVLGVRFGHHSLDVQRPMFYYRADYARFMDECHTREFMLLSSAVWEFDTPQNLIAQAMNAADNLTSVTVDELQPDEVTVSRSIVQALIAFPGAFAGITDRIDNFIKPATQGQIILQLPLGQGANLIPAGSLYDNNGQFQLLNILVSNTNYQIVFGANDIALRPNPTLLAPGTYNFTTPDFNGVPPASPDILFGQPNTPVTATLQLFGTPITTLQAGDLSAPLCQRIQLVGKPNTTQQQSQNLHILGKRISPPFSADTDIPGINGLDGIIAALAYYDFKQRDEQGGSPDASAALNEAVGPKFLVGGKPGGWLGKLIESEVIQAAYNCRIIPSQGFGGGGFDEPQGSKCAPYGGYY